MKPKINIQTFILCTTGTLFILGLFYIGWNTHRQIRSADSEFSAFEKQLQETRDSFTDANTAFSSAIQSEKDILNWRARKAAGVSSISQDADPDPDASSDTKPSIFSQNTSPEYESYSDESIFSDN